MRGPRALCACFLALLASSSLPAQLRNTGAVGSTLRGCWRTDRPLGPTGGETPVDRDAGFTVFVLRDSGRIALPLVPERERRMWEGRSWWNVQNDTLTLVVFTGLQGWRATVPGASSRQILRGGARYLSDVIVAGGVPTGVPVSLARIACEADWPSVSSTARSLRPWERGQQPYFQHQVDEPAAVRAGKLPAGLRAIRALRFDERALPDSLDVQRGVVPVFMQFVIEPDGRADGTNVKVLGRNGSADTVRIRRIVSALRFTPAKRKGAAVHQLAQMRLDLAR
jgi:hypothetical protein